MLRPYKGNEGSRLEAGATKMGQPLKSVHNDSGGLNAENKKPEHRRQRERSEPGRVVQKQKTPTKRSGHTFLRRLLYYISASLVK